MYQTYWNLREKPFQTTPDPRFLYGAPSHREALAQLEYAVRERAGFLVLTGEVGTGKTTLLHTLMKRVDADTDVAYVFHSTLTFPDLLEYVLDDLGAECTHKSVARRIAALNRHLAARARESRTTVLVIDEAHNLGFDALEGIRMLSNFETATEKLLQILLVGQPELAFRLDGHDLRQLRERVALRCELRPFSRGEVGDYVRHRWSIAAGADGNGSASNGVPPHPFDEGAIARVAELSRGIPRRVNLLCEHALVAGYAEQRRRIDSAAIDEAARDLEGGRRRRQPGEPR